MSTIADDQTIEKLSSLLIDTSLPLKLRFRILFTLKNLDSQLPQQQQQQQAEKSSQVVEAISQAFQDSSALLKHECAYCLGQMGNQYAISKLLQVLSDTNEDPMVRHEAGEALGALGCYENEEVIKALTTQSQNPRAEISETCQIALDRLSWIKKNALANSDDKLYLTIDPAPALTSTNVGELKAALLDENRSLFERYRAMFALRNLGTDEAVLALCEGFQSSSALFRHEVAFVLGQLQSTCSIPALHQQLAIGDENYMVRHECAETLGSIGTNECREILEKYLHDQERVVRESCEVALDISDYVNSGDFQYCNGLKLVESECC